MTGEATTTDREAARPSSLRAVVTEAMAESERTEMDAETRDEWVTIRVLAFLDLPARDKATAARTLREAATEGAGQVSVAGMVLDAVAVDWLNGRADEIEAGA